MLNKHYIYGKQLNKANYALSFFRFCLFFTFAKLTFKKNTTSYIIPLLLFIDYFLCIYLYVFVGTNNYKNKTMQPANIFVTMKGEQKDIYIYIL